MTARGEGMTALVSYDLDNGIAFVTMDDGKVNVMSMQMLGDINATLDRAEADRAVVVLSGREGVFSAGFDLPVVMVGTGHAVAMGAFLLLSGDYRLGPSGSYKLTANEVAIGLTMPRTAV